MKPSTTIDLQTPPSSTDSTEFRAWRETAGRQIHGIKAISGTVAITMHVGLPPSLSGLEQVARDVVALLEAKDIIGEDSVSDLALRWDRTVQAGTVQIVMREVTPPHCRIGADARAKVSAAMRARWAAVRLEKGNAPEAA